MLAPMAQISSGRWILSQTSSAMGAPLGACRHRLPATGFRTLTVVDTCTRECLALIADTSLSGARVARELATILEQRGKPLMIISDRRRSENDPGDHFPEEGHRVHLERDPRLRR